MKNENKPQVPDVKNSDIKARALLAEIQAMLRHGDARLSYEYQRELVGRIGAVLGGN